MDGVVGTAATQIDYRHLDLHIAGLGGTFKQGCRGHHLTRLLAIAARPLNRSLPDTALSR
jgi:hypothetical protein